MEDLVTAWFTSFVLLIASYVAYFAYQRYQNFQVFLRMEVPGPKPHFLWGNMVDMKCGTKLPASTMVRWREQFGLVYGYFRGRCPTLVIADPELMKRVLISDFQNFVNRPDPPYLMKVVADSLLGLKDEVWKDVRRTITPTFSASKMKQLISIMNRTVKVFGEQVEEFGSNGQEFDICDRFQRLTLHIIGECALALKINCQKDSEDLTFATVRNMMKGIEHPLTRMLEYFPKVVVLLQYWFRAQPVMKMNEGLVRNLRLVIRERRRTPTKKTLDVLQLMIDAADEAAASPGSGQAETVNGTAQTKDQKSALTDDHIVGNCWVFLLAGFETTATALAFTAHMLVMHQDVQEKVYREIVDNIQDDKTPTYDDANNLQYLDQVINETLRIYPPVVLFMTRECANDYDLEGITIPAGMKVEIPIYSIHHDPKLWPDPEKFDPERFSPENKGKIHPMAHIPFGAGPRNCIGMRFALLEAKLTLIRLVRNYRLLPSSKTKDPPEVTVPHATYTPKNGIYLKVEKRKQ